VLGIEYGAGPTYAVTLRCVPTGVAPAPLQQLNANSGTTLISIVMSQSFCNNGLFLPTDFTVSINGNPVAITEIRRPQGTNLTTTATCDAARGAPAGPNTISFTAINLGISQPLVVGDFITVTATCIGPGDAFSPCTAGAAGKIQDLLGNVMQSAQTVTGTATSDTTRPSLSTALALTSTALRLTFNEPVLCGTGNASGLLPAFLQQFTITVGTNASSPTSATCPASNNLGATRITLNSAADLSGGGSVSYQENATSSARVKDLSGNNATSPQTISFAAIPGPTPPLITDAHVTTNVGTSNFGDVGDAFTLIFNEQMNNVTSGLSILTTDNDPGASRDMPVWVCGTNVSCSWDAARTMLTSTVTTATAGVGGSTPGLQLPLNITATTGITDVDDFVAPNLAASDTLIQAVVIPVVTPPVITFALVSANVGASTFGDVGDAFSLTFSELMNDTAIQTQTTDNDPGTTKGVGNWVCGSNVSCVWNPAHTAVVVTVTVTTPPAAASSDGSTPGLQLPLTITAIPGATDFDDNAAPNLAGSDTVIEAASPPQLNASSGTNVISILMGQASCITSPLAASDFVLTINGNPVGVTEIRRPQGTNLATTATCDAARGEAAGTNLVSFTAINLGVATPLASGVAVSVTITCTATDSLGCSAGGASKIQDMTGHVLPGALTVTGTVAPDTTRPTLASTTTLISTQVRLTFSEPVLCGTGNSQGSAFGFLQQFTITAGGTSSTPSSVGCPASSSMGATRLTLRSSVDISSGGSVTYQESATSAERVKDLSGNNATSPQTITFAALPVATPPLIADAHVTVNVASSNFGDIGDSFSLAFIEQMSTFTGGMSIQTTDNDPGATKDVAVWACGSNANCVWNATTIVLTVTVTAATPGTGGSTPGLQLPLSITATSGIADFDDFIPPNLAASDTLIN